MFRNQENGAGDTGYTAIPSDFIADTRLSWKARFAAIYLSSFGRDFIFSASAAQKGLGVGRDAWKSISRELRKFGLLEDVISKDGSGRVIGKGLRFKGL